MSGFDFTPSEPLSIGVELELQLLNARDCDLTRAASDLLAVVGRLGHPGDIKPEVTESMIEVSSGVHANGDSLLAELREMRSVLQAASRRLNILIAGGGAHPFQHWTERQIYETRRFRRLSELYGYLAKQFTIFGQHIHIGCPSGDQAMQLLHRLSRYVPHFIALAASSPYSQGVDTAFDSSRLNAIAAFPLSGRAPFLLTWQSFTDYFERMRGSGVVASMKDFYWDIRPKPEYGTVEIRVCDTPLTVERATALAVYAQVLSRSLMEAGAPPREDEYLVYSYNRFQACRFGMEADLIDPSTLEHRSLREDLLATLDTLRPHAASMSALEPMDTLYALVREGGNDAQWLRGHYQRVHSLESLMWQAARRWEGHLED